MSLFPKSSMEILQITIKGVLFNLDRLYGF